MAAKPVTLTLTQRKGDNRTYKVSQIKNSTDWYIGQGLSKKDVDAIIEKREVEVIVKEGK